MGYRAVTRLSAAIFCVAALAFAVGCGEDSGESAGSGAEGGDDSAYLAEVNKRVDGYLNESGFSEPPADSPPPQTGKKVAIVTFGLASPVGADFAQGAEAAGQLLGWETTVFDGKFSQEKYLEGIRQAIAGGSDAIVLYLIDCAGVKAGLEEARDAGIVVVTAESADCNIAEDGPQLFDGEVTWKEGNFVDWVEGLAGVQADWVIANSDGEAKVILFKEKDLFIASRQAEAFVEELEGCSGCEVLEEVDFVATEFGPALQAKAEQALLQHPDANAVVVPYDDLMSAGVAAAVNSSGRNDEILSVGGVGYPANIQLARTNRGQDAGYGISVTWEGWSAMDVTNRLLAGEEPAGSGMSIGLWDADHLPESEGWKPEIDFEAAYEEAWASAEGAQ